MARAGKLNSSRLAAVFVACIVVLLGFVLGSLTIHCRALEQELDRMLVESMVVHTTENGENVRDLIGEVRVVLNNAAEALLADGRPLEEDWVSRLLNTMGLGEYRFTLSYINLDELRRAEPGSEEQKLYNWLLTGESAVSGVITTVEDRSEDYFLIARPLERDGSILGAVSARMNANLLVRQGRRSGMFQSIHSVIAGADGTIIYGNTPDTKGVGLVELGLADGLSEQESEEFASSYAINTSGSFCYDVEDGRHYAAWAPAFCNGWRVVQFSRSPDVRIARNTIFQTSVMVVSLALCVFLSAMVWRQRTRLAEEHLRYNALSEFRDTLLFEYNCEDDSLEFTSNALSTLDLKNVRLEEITKDEKEYPVFHPDDMETVKRALRETVSMIPNQLEHDRIRMKKRDGKYNWYRSQYKAVPTPDGQSVRLIGTLTDINMQVDQERELRKQAQQDPLTGLYNRAGVKLINARLEQISRGILFMMDLDDFKLINDTYGHAAGDKFLVAISQILLETFRTDDIVARVGGDEFVAFLSGSDSRSTAEQKAQELLERVRTLKVEGIDAKASISVGAASAPSQGRTYEELSQAADGALYQVKKNGKGGFRMR